MTDWSLMLYRERSGKGEEIVRRKLREGTRPKHAHCTINKPFLPSSVNYLYLCDNLCRCAVAAVPYVVHEDGPNEDLCRLSAWYQAEHHSPLPKLRIGYPKEQTHHTIYIYLWTGEDKYTTVGILLIRTVRPIPIPLGFGFLAYTQYVTYTQHRCRSLPRPNAWDPG